MAGDLFTLAMESAPGAPPRVGGTSRATSTGSTLGWMFPDAVPLIVHFIAHSRPRWHA
jgi:hypothetical protein